MAKKAVRIIYEQLTDSYYSVGVKSTSKKK